MTIHAIENYTSPTPTYADNDGDLFDRLHVADTTVALGIHDHTIGHGLPVARVAATVLGQSTAFAWALGVL